MTDLQAKAEAAADAVDRLSRELDITNADHIALWLEGNTIPDEPMSQCISWLACRIVEAHERAMANALQSEYRLPFNSARFLPGAHVTKRSGSHWSGRIVGIYSTSLTPVGYAVESDRHPGSVQIYPEAALMPTPPEGETP